MELDRTDRISKICDVIKLVADIKYRDSNMLRDLAFLIENMKTARKSLKPEEFVAIFGMLVDVTDENDDEERQEALDDTMREFDSMFNRLRIFMDIYWQQQDPNA